MKTLFVNACMRSRNSHTLELCQHYLQGKVYETVDLEQLQLAPFDFTRAAQRARLEKEGAWDDPYFDLAKQLKEADEVLIGAPYWDLSFPAALKTYIEHTSIDGLTFHFTEEGTCEGLCKSKRLVYVSSCGGYLDGANFGFEYLCGIARMFKLGDCYQIAAQGMDVIGNDTEAEMQKAFEQIDQLKESFSES